MFNKNKHGGRGIEAIKARYGWICVSPWVLGLIVFFIIPIFQSILYSFTKVTLLTGGFKYEWMGFKNFRQIIMADTSFTDNLASSVGTFAYSFPIILILSLVLSLLLNQKFKGRIVFRAIYFLPVIIASGVVLGTVLGGTNVSSTAQTDETIATNMINVAELIEWTGLPEEIGGYFQSAITSIMNLLWSCGVQIILFIAGMQSIPDLYYEVSKVEGATGWEEFWFITLPSLSRVITLVTVYTMVELMTSRTDRIITQAYDYMSAQRYGESSAILWIYFLIIGAILGSILFLFNHFCARKWE